jgi:hypothetical protein
MSIRDVTRLIDDFAYRHKTTGVMWARGQEGGNSTWPEQRKAILDSIDALQTNAYAEGRKDERDQCAQLCESYAQSHAKGDDESKAQAWMMLQCAARIRQQL